MNNQYQPIYHMLGFFLTWMVLDSSTVQQLSFQILLLQFIC